MSMCTYYNTVVETGRGSFSIPSCGYCLACIRFFIWETESVKEHLFSNLGVSRFFMFYVFVQEEAIPLIESNSKDIYIVTKCSYFK